MVSKRPRDETAGEAGQKRRKTGFQVGPANLPEGIHKRKVQKIKANLIHKAKIKKEFAKVKARHDQQAAVVPSKSPYDELKDEEARDDDTSDHEAASADSQMNEDEQATSNEPHPSRAHLIRNPDSRSPVPDPVAQAQPVNAEDADPNRTSKGNLLRHQRRKHDPYAPASQAAQRQRDLAEQKRREREEAELARQQKREERDKFRRQMAKARRPGKDGKRRLGRESTALLDKVRRLVGDG